MRHYEHNRVADDRHDIESNQRAPMTKAIRNDDSGPCVNRAEKRLDRIIVSDDERRRTESLKILWNKAHPQLLARTNDHNRKQQDDYVALEREELRQPPRGVPHETHPAEITRRWHSA